MHKEQANLASDTDTALTHWSLGGFDYTLKFVIFKLISTINILIIFCEIAISLMPQRPTDH